SGDQPSEILNRAWFYFPRMLHPESQVFLQRPCAPGGLAPYDRLGLAEIAARAGQMRHRRAA
ncbi:MAG: hypothetical protein ACYC6Y_29430, partial [Thermoguttaceae bacterium]